MINKSVNSIFAVLFLVVFSSCGEIQRSKNIVNIESKNVVYLENGLWNNGSTLNVLFYNGTSDSINTIKDIASEWTKYANISFEFYTEQNIGSKRAHIRVELDATKCNGSSSSAMGKHSLYTKERHSMCLVSIDAHTVLHEFGHALGLAHEHHHPELMSKFVDNVIDVCMERFKITSEQCERNLLAKTFQLAHEGYDPKSIMHYSFHHEFFKDGKSRTKYISELSSNDKLSIASLYPGKKPEIEIANEIINERPKKKPKLTITKVIKAPKSDENNDDSGMIPMTDDRVKCRIFDFNIKSLPHTRFCEEGQYYIQRKAGSISKGGKTQILWTTLEDHPCYDTMDELMMAMKTAAKCH